MHVLFELEMADSPCHLWIQLLPQLASHLGEADQLVLTEVRGVVLLLELQFMVVLGQGLVGYLE